MALENPTFSGKLFELLISGAHDGGLSSPRKMAGKLTNTPHLVFSKGDKSDLNEEEAHNGPTHRHAHRP
jgi:hypothetical protein